MNILYISKIDGRPWIGPTYSVPNQVAAQSQYDNVFWYNIVDSGEDAGKENLKIWRELNYYHDLKDFPSQKINDLPSPFNNPDLIIMEQGYPFAKDKIRREVFKSEIPYIIVPRGELTTTAQKKKKIKKIIGNILLDYHRFVKKAVAIQCLTEQEEIGTKNKWNNVKIILPNGTELHNVKHNYSDKKSLNGVFIGRIETYQKGLDILVDACEIVKKKLKASKCHIHLYGSDRENKLAPLLELIEQRDLSDIISFHGPVFGKEKAKVLSDADFFIITSRFEGHPMGLLEALAYGLPSLVTTGSNMRLEVETNKAGWGADNNAVSVASAFERLVADVDNYQKMSQNACKLAEMYSWEAIAQKSHVNYIELLQKRRREK